MKIKNWPTSIAWFAYFVVSPIKIDEDGFGDILGGRHRELMRLDGLEA